jgi:hypothetical protein
LTCTDKNHWSASRDTLAQDPAGPAHCLAQAHPSDLGQHGRLLVEAKLVVGDIEAIGAAPLLLEARRTGLFSSAALREITAPRPGKIGEGVCVGVAVHGTQPGIAIGIEPGRVKVLDGVELPFERHRIGLAAAGHLTKRLGQRPVPDPACSAGRAREILALLVRRVDPDPVRQQHGPRVRA